MFRTDLASRRRRSDAFRRPRAARGGRRPALDLLEERQLLASSLTTFSLPINPAPVAGQTFTSAVARFTDSDGNTDPGQYSATINWGDGHTSTATISVDPRGGFDVNGSHAFPRPGAFRVTAQISDKDGASGMVATSNVVADAALSATGGLIVNASAGHAVNALVATFTSANHFAKAGDFAATIWWGDGQSSNGMILADKGIGGFDVKGSHTYAAPGAYSVQVQVRAGGPGVTMTQFYTPANLISDGAVSADHVNSLFKNPWGLVSGAGGPFWNTNNGTGTSSLLDGAGNVNVGLPFVTVPPPDGSMDTSAPTGIVMNTDNTAFKVTVGQASGSAIFLFATEDGTISGWNPNVSTNGSKPSNTAILAVDNSGEEAIYKGLALLKIPAGTLLPAGSYLFATNFHSGNIDVFDAMFQPVTLPAGAFHDPTLPAGYAPFGIQAIGDKLYVTYAQQDADKEDDVAGPGHGFVDVYNTSGFFIQRLGGAGFQPELNSPWGITKAPANFGQFSNDILVGNFGDSHVSAFDPVTGAFLGQLSDAKGQPLALVGGFKGHDTKGLWGIAFGNGTGSGPSNTLFFNSGFNDEEDGVFGSLTPSSFSTAMATSIASVTPKQAGGSHVSRPSAAPSISSPSKPSVDTNSTPPAIAIAAPAAPVSNPVATATASSGPHAFSAAGAHGPGEASLQAMFGSMFRRGRRFHRPTHRPMGHALRPGTGHVGLYSFHHA